MSKVQQKLQAYKCEHVQQTITVEKLDSLMDWAMDPKSGKVAFIFHAIKIFAVFAYVWTRDKLVEEAWHLSRQKYEQERSARNRREVNI